MLAELSVTRQSLDPTLSGSRTPSRSTHLSPDGVSLETDLREPLLEDCTSYGIYRLDAEFHEHMHVINTVDDTPDRYGARALQQSHSIGHPYEALSLCAAPPPHPLPLQVPSATDKSMSTEPVTDIQDVPVNDSMRRVD